MIPDTVVLGGTFRAFSNTSFYQLLERIEQVRWKVYECEWKERIKNRWWMLFWKTGDCWTGECVQMLGRGWFLWKGIHHLSSNSKRWENVWACEEGIHWFAGSEEFQGSSTYDGCWRFLLLLRGGSLSFLLHWDKEWNIGVYSYGSLSLFHDWWRRSTNRCCYSCHYCREVPHSTCLIFFSHQILFSQLRTKFAPFLLMFLQE